MFKFIKNLIISIRCGKLWVQALDFAANKNNDEAKRVLIKIEDLLKVTNVECGLLRGYVELCLGNKSESRKFLDVALRRLDTENRYSTVDTDYMKTYANELKNYLLDENDQFITINYEKLELKKVSKHLIDNFPLTGFF